MSESLFDKVAGLKAYNFNKKRLLHRCFPVNIAKFLRTALFIEPLWWLLLYLFNKVAGLMTSNVIKNRLQHRCRTVNKRCYNDSLCLHEYPKMIGLVTIFRSGWNLDMVETCAHDYTYIADYMCLCCDDVEPKYLESNKQ